MYTFRIWVWKPAPAPSTQKCDHRITMSTISQLHKQKNSTFPPRTPSPWPQNPAPRPGLKTPYHALASKPVPHLTYGSCRGYAEHSSPAAREGPRPLDGLDGVGQTGAGWAGRWIRAGHASRSWRGRQGKAGGAGGSGGPGGSGGGLKGLIIINENSW